MSCSCTNHTTDVAPAASEDKKLTAVYEAYDLQWETTADGLVAHGQKGKFQIVQVATSKIGSGEKPIILLLDGHTVDRYHDVVQAKKAAAHLNAMHEYVANPVVGPVPPATVVVTRHAALVQLLVERGIVMPGTPVIAHATPEDVRGKHVIGVLPMPLAALAICVTEVQLNMAPEDRGVELPIERLRVIAGPAVTYRISKVQYAQCSNAAVVTGLALETQESCPVTAVGWRDPRFAKCYARAKGIGPINSSKEVYELLHDSLKDEDQECYVVVLVNVRRELIDVYEVNRGMNASVQVSVRKTHYYAVTTKGCAGVVIVHQHPTGKANPSGADANLTKAVERSFEQFGDECKFLDHVVLGHKQAYSFRDAEKLGPKEALHHF